jgi:hypothetical protein
MKRDVADMTARLGAGGAIDRAADILASMLSP